MSDRDEGNPGRRRPPQGSVGKGRATSRPVEGKGGGKPKGGVRLKHLDDRDYALDHPKCIHEMELDYAEGIELRKEGDPEGARDALRFALQGCGDNMWVHCAHGWIALEDFNDPSLARGHFGYGFELALKAIPRDFNGRLPREHTANQPLYDAIDGLILCYEKLGQPSHADELREVAGRWLSGPKRGRS